MTIATANNRLATDAGLGHWTLGAQSSTVGVAHKVPGGMVTVKSVFTSVDGEGSIGVGGTLAGTVTVRAVLNHR
jgi:hypothetical protein